jgi:hypothetical protein
MISFLTLFLGLIAGIQPVEVSVAGTVAAVEVVLDGATVDRLEKPPWSTRVDFGRDLAPHELVTRALDEKGREIGHARQWINLPRPPAEIEILLERDEEGRATEGRLVAESLFGTKPLSIAAVFDGKPVGIPDGRRFHLPPYDSATTHLLVITADFPNGVRSRRDLVLGGLAASQVVTELTALPVRVRREATLPAAVEELAGWFVRRGEPLEPVAVERAPAQVLLVRSLDNKEAMKRLGSGGRTVFQSRRALNFAVPGLLPVYDPNATRTEMRLEDADRVRFVWPRARVAESSSTRSELFDTSHDFTGRDGGLHWLLTRVDHPDPVEPHPRFADAVAIAGLQALASRSRRAVVLVLGRPVADASRFSPATVRKYLEAIRVPFFVWSLEGTGSSPWGEMEDVSTVVKLRDAVDRLRTELSSQAMVWVRGEHLPQEITLSPDARGIELIR